MSRKSIPVGYSEIDLTGVKFMTDQQQPRQLDTVQPVQDWNWKKIAGFSLLSLLSMGIGKSVEAGSITWHNFTDPVTSNPVQLSAILTTVLTALFAKAPHK